MLFVPYLEPAEDSSHSAVQAVPAPVAFVDHGFELAGPVSAVLSGQAAILVIHQFQLSQPLMNLPLETLQKIIKRWNEFWIYGTKCFNKSVYTALLPANTCFCFCYCCGVLF